MGVVSETAQFDSLPDLEAVRQAVERRFGLAVSLESNDPNFGTLVPACAPEAHQLTVTRLRLYDPQLLLSAEDRCKYELSPRTGEPGTIGLQGALNDEPSMMLHAMMALVDLGGRPRSSFAELQAEGAAEEDVAPLTEAEFWQRVEQHRKRWRRLRWVVVPLFVVSMAFWVVGFLALAGVLLLLFPFLWVGAALYTWLRERRER